MPISVTCPGCSAELNAPVTPTSAQLECPKCQSIILVPASGADPVRPREGANRAILYTAGAVVLVVTISAIGFALLSRDGTKERASLGDKDSPPVRADAPTPPARNENTRESAAPAPAPKELAAYTSINDLVVSADGTTLAANGEVASPAVLTPGLRVWRLAGGTPSDPRELRGAPQLMPEDRIALSSDGRAVAALSSTPENEPIIVVWDAASGAIIRQAKAPGLGKVWFGSRIGFTSDGTAVVAISGSSVATVAIATGRVSVKKQPEKPTGMMSYVPGLRRIIWGQQRKKTEPTELFLWDPEATAPAEKVALGTVEGSSFHFVASADGKAVAVSSFGSSVGQPQVALFELPSGKALGRLPIEPHSTLDYIRSITLSADGKFVAVVSMGAGSQGVLLFRVSDRRQIAHFTERESDKTRSSAEPCFAAYGKKLYYVKAGNTIAAIDTETGNETVY